MWRSAIVIALGLPGALAAAWVGFMAAEFSGDASPTRMSFYCWHVWGVFGGACFGALPGLLVGWMLRVRWVIPVLGAAVGVVPGLFEASGVHVLGGTNLGGYASAGSVLLGFGFGPCLWIIIAKRDGDRVKTVIAGAAGGD